MLGGDSPTTLTEAWGCGASVTAKLWQDDGRRRLTPTSMSEHWPRIRPRAMSRSGAVW